MNQQFFMQLKGITPAEYQFLEQLTKSMSEGQLKTFTMFYTGKRKDPQDILLFTLLGLVVVAGVQRFVVGQIGMGLLYLFIGGLCLIGTIVDLVNHKSIAQEYNQKVAMEAAKMSRMGL